MKEVVKSQEHINAEFNDQTKKHKILVETIAKLELSLKASKTDVKNLEKLVTDLQTKTNNNSTANNDLEQYGRRDMVDICGIPRHANEDTDQIVLNIAAELDVTVKKSDIAISHRTKPTPEAPIIVKFVSRRVRNSFFYKRNILKEKTLNYFGFQGNTGKLYINESLTALNGELLKNTRKQLKGKNFKYIWTKNGTIFVRKDDTSEKTIIRSIKDLAKLTDTTNDR